MEEVVVRAEEIAQAEFLVEQPHFLGDAVAALEAVLALVVGGDGAILAGEFAAKRQHDGADRGELAHPTYRKRLRTKRAAAAGRFAQAIPERGQRRFVE